MTDGRAAATLVSVPAAASVRLLGRFELHLDGEAETRLDVGRAELLLTYLLLHRDAQPRRRLAFALWPDSDEAQAQTNLRKLLHTLRTRVPAIDRYVEITPRVVGWRTDAAIRIDVDEFEKLTAGRHERDGHGQSGARLAALRTAVTLYRGDLLDGHDQPWLQPEQQRLRTRYLDALDELADLCEAAGELPEAVIHAEQRLRADPLREASYRTLMRLHAAHGDPARALGVYHECSTVLENELGVAPSPATRAAYAALLPRETGNPRESLAGGATLVGRAAERRQLVEVWRTALTGRPQFVLLTGEAGVGKTRLAEDFRIWCGRQGAVVAEARCHSAEGPLVYGPVTAWLRSSALRPRLALLDRERRSEIARLLPELLAEAPDTPKPEPLSADEQRRRLLEAVATAMLAGSAPRLLVLDDVQHVDRETCRLLHYLLRREPTGKLVVVATARPEEIDRDHPVYELLAGLHTMDRCVEIELGRLDHAETDLLARRLADTPLDTGRLFEETEGNPFFVVEALRAGWRPDAPVSRRVQTVLEARLAQLSSQARELAEVAATIGREFRVDVLAAAAGVDDTALLDGLDELWRRRILRERNAEVYWFSHDKIREVAALGVSPPRRRLLHLRIAPAIERAYAADPAHVSGQIAMHYARGGSAGHAVTWYRRAAEAAQELHASSSAVDLLQQALQELLTLQASRDRDQAELDLRNAVLGPLASVTGYVSPAIEAHQREAAQLTRTLGASPAPPLLRSLGMSALTGEDFSTTMRIGAQLQAAGEHLDDDVLVVEGAYLLGMSAFWQTDFGRARIHLETAVERYRAVDLWTHLVRYGQDPKVACLSRLGNTLWFLGLPEAALRARDAALDWAGQIAQPFSTSIALLFAAVLAIDMDDEVALRLHTAGLEALGATAPPFALTATALRGCLSVLDGQQAAGIAAIDRAIRDAGRQGPAPGVPAILARIRLAAAVATNDATRALAAAEALLDMGGAADVWAPLAGRVTEAFRGAGG